MTSRRSEEVLVYNVGYAKFLFNHEGQNLFIKNYSITKEKTDFSVFILQCFVSEMKCFEICSPNHRLENVTDAITGILKIHFLNRVTDEVST